MFVDTHVHLNMMVKKDFDTQLNEKDLITIDQVIKEAEGVNVNKFITVGTSVIESLNCIFIAKKFENVFVSIGLHPCDCTSDWKKDFIKIKNLVDKKEENKVVAIGEIGLDFFHKPFFKQRQIDAFKSHIELAILKELPIIVHVRDAQDELLKVLQEYKNQIDGVIHCFMYKKDFTKIILDWGFYIGINAPITYPKNEWFKVVLQDIPLQRILLETDCPFLPPQQFRGKQNRPSYIPITAKALADIKDVDIVEVENITTQNVKDLFGI